MRPINLLRRGFLLAAAVVTAAVLAPASAHGANPRWTTGWPYFQNNNGNPVVWYTNQPLYYTDPGDLSGYVNHAAADALVASAAAVWNNSMSSMTLAQGGALNQHVSSGNVYLGSNGPVFPSDVQATNSAAKQIAVIYDTDGSVTDTLLGGGASDPTSCRQNAVTESVDSIATNGQIQHALLILNGRCTGSGTAPQQEMKYRLVRAFGRILGLGWSQLNDNVFTGSPQATTLQAQNWPIMHPIDVLCGTYAYQCLVNPFTLRTDDLAGLITLYPVNNAGGGKTASYANAAKVNGFVSFANGQGMQGLLVSLRRFHFGPGYMDAFDLTSAITGANFQGISSNPMTPKGSTLANSVGSTNTYYEGYYALGWVPVPPTDTFDNFTVTTSSINPLYTGQYAVGPYQLSQVTPSGPAMTNTAYVVNTLYGAQLDLAATGPGNQTTAAAPTTCGGTSDGTESVPLPVASSGSWSGALCGYQHSAWSSLAVKAGRSLTMEVTAIDEQSYATTGKMLPVMGVWSSGDATGIAPTIASQAAALNATTLGMTNLRASTTTARTFRIGLADQRGDGRPDYAYNARILYADSVSPASLPANGGAVTLSGMGFRPGNTVTVNGVVANVTGWTANTITLVAPPITGPLNADIVVNDLSTGGQTIMTGALTYSQTAQPDVLAVVSKPANGGYVGSPGSPVFKVQVLLPDGVTPAAGVATTLASTAATFGACSNGTSCTLTTDASGYVSSTVTPTAAGTITLTGTVGSSSVSTTFVALAVPVDALSVLSLPSGTVYATLPAATSFTVQVMLPDGVTAASGATVVVTAGNATLAACAGLSTCTLTADGSGRVSTTVTPLAAGVVSLLASAGGGMVSASFGASALPADMLHLASKPADGSYVGRVASLPFAFQVFLGDNATPASGASVTLTATNATLAACGGASCSVAANSLGNVSTTVTPTSAGTVTLVASAGGGTLSTTFTAADVPPDTLTVVTQPANGAYVGRAAAVPFSVQVAQGDGSGVAPGVSVTVTAANATLGCGTSTCILTANSLGAISTAVTPSAVGTVTLTASAGGGTVSTTFTAIAVPPDVLHIVSQPAAGSYAGRAAALPFTLTVALGDTGSPAAGVTVTVTATNATLTACGAVTCALTADASGSVSTTVVPAVPGAVTLSAAAGGGTASVTFNAVAVPPDMLTVVTQPANGSYAGVPAATAFSVNVLLGDTGGPATGATVMVTATNGTLGCGASTCSLVASVAGTVSTRVTPLAPGAVTLTATAGGGTATASFTAVPVPPDTLQVVTAPANNTLAGSPATLPLALSVLLGDGITPAANATVTITATNGTLGACGLASCTLSASLLGGVSTPVTATSAGTVTLTASAGGGTISVTFTAIAIPDVVTVTSVPSDSSYVGRVAATPFTVQVSLGNAVNPQAAHTVAALATHALAARTVVPFVARPPDAGVPVTMTAVGATLGACGLPTCVVTSDSNGNASTTVTPILPGPVSLSASAGGATASSNFNATTPPDVVTITSTPANGSFVNRVASVSFTTQIYLGDGTTPAAGVGVTLTSTNGTLGVCGLATCIVTANSLGVVSTQVTPAATGVVTLSASAGGGSANASFTAAAVPPDTLHVVSQPASGSYVQRAAAIAFSVQTLLGDTGGPAAGVSVTVTALNATFTACSASTCVLTADSSGTVSSSVVPAAAGIVSLTAGAGGGSVSTTFTAVAVPPDALHIVTQPANGSYTQRTAAIPFTIQAALGDTGGPAAGASFTLTATNATLNACGLSTCVLVADSMGTVSTSVTPTAAGLVTLTAAAGGGSVSTTFTAVAVPPDTLHVVAQPANGSYTQRTAAIPFTVQAALGDTGGPAAGASFTLTATNATFNACGLSTCVLIADSMGTVSTSVTPTAAALVTLSAAAGGGSVSTTFTAVAVPPDALHIVTQPANGSYTQRTAAMPFRVEALLGDTGGPAAGASVTLTATNATLTVCGLASCVVTADSTGSVSSTVTPTTAGSVQLTATAGGGTVTTTFTAVPVPPDSLLVTSRPPDGSAVGIPSPVRFAVQTLLGDTGGPAAGASVTVTASNALLGACNLATCVLTSDASGNISTAVTPFAAGPVSLTATAGGGTVSTSFNALPDVLHISSQPAGSVYATLPATSPFTVQVMLPGGAPAAGAAVTLSATRAIFNGCGSASCVLTADGSGTVTTTVTPQQAGVITLQASAGGGVVTTTFTALTLPADILTVISAPVTPVYVGVPAATHFAAHVVLGDGATPAAGATVSLTATGATLAACGGSTCTVAADSSGNVSTGVTPLAPGVVTLTAAAGGGSVSTSFAVSPDVLTVLTIPANGTYTGSPALLPFAVRVLLGDGATIAPGTTAVVTATNATLGVCGLSTCTVAADSAGTVSTLVTALSGGPVTLTASAAGGTASATFTASAPPNVLTVLSAPASGSYVGRSSATPFTVQVTVGTALNHFAATAPTAIAGAVVTLSASGGTLDACSLSTCTLTADANGLVSTTVTPTSTGTVTLSASAGGGSIASEFTAVPVPDVLRVLSLPANGTYFGRVAGSPFAVQVFAGDGTTPAAGVSVTLSASGATLACGQATCSVTANSTGIVSTTVTPTVAGTVTLTALAGGGTIAASFSAATPPDILHVISVPADGSYTGRAAAIPFTVQVLLGDGTTPHSGASVTLTANNALFSVCGQSTCTASADANGLFSTSILPVVAGPVTLTAAAASGVATAEFTAADPIRTIAIARATEYIAADRTVTWTASVALLENGLPVAGVPVTWTALDPGLTPAAATSSTDASGSASQPLSLGPLAGGATTGGRACAWATVCVSFTAQAVDPSSWRVATVSGDTQTVPFGGTLEPVILRAVDDAGHWVAGVPIEAHQTVRAWVSCPSSGRCPTAPVLNTSSATIVSDGDGKGVLTPLQTSSAPETTEIVAAAGPNGYLSLSLSKIP